MLEPTSLKRLQEVKKTVDFECEIAEEKRLEELTDENIVNNFKKILF